MTYNGDGNFTLPGEAGYEELCLKLAKTWGADMIRDSDGTKLSRTLTEAGLGVYSTICIIREHNPWIKEHMHTLQQCFLCTEAKTAASNEMVVNLMENYFDGQFRVNDREESVALWQVFDRTTGDEVKKWKYDVESGCVSFETKKWHKYTVNFLAWRLWEEISMYNHTTNNWKSEPLMQLDPIYPEVREYLKRWLEAWCAEHEDTEVVRFTSLFYNFAWIWGANERKRHLFSDWAAYDFAVSPLALEKFSKRFGYALTSEDFINNGYYNATHRPPKQTKLDWIVFVSDFVRGFGRELVDIVHKHGKKAYVFCDDSWIGLEPYNGRFDEFGFDGFIKCLFSGYEARFCAGVDVPVHELRFHPYLFPVGLGGLPTFSEGGNPKSDALKYWVNVRRALLRQKVERAGLGGYPHLVEGFPDFVDCVTDILSEFRQITALHLQAKPFILPVKIGVLHSWGKLRSWTLSGHFHETDDYVLVHILEALSGLPLDVEFIDFKEAAQTDLARFGAIINAGRAGDAWSGGDSWKNVELCEKITEFVSNGGVFFGVSEPSAVCGFDTFFRMANVLGVDLDDGRYASHGKYCFNAENPLNVSANLPSKKGVCLIDKDTRVLLADGCWPTVTFNSFGKGSGVYLSGFLAGHENNRFLMELLLYAAKVANRDGITDNPNVECAIFPSKIAVVNNSFEAQKANFMFNDKKYSVTLKAAELQIL